MEEDVLNEFLFSVINASIDSVILSNVIGAFDSIKCTELRTHHVGSEDIRRNFPLKFSAMNKIYFIHQARRRCSFNN